MEKLDLSTLLKLKKYERPDEAFWNSFDMKLRQRTLKTLVERTSLRSRIYLKFRSALHPGLAMPAAAAVALAVYFSVPQAPSPAPQNDRTTAPSIAVVASTEDAFISGADVETQFKPIVMSGPLTVVMSNPVKNNEDFTKILILAQQTMIAGKGVSYAANDMTAGTHIGLPATSYSPLF